MTLRELTRRPTPRRGDVFRLDVFLPRTWGQTLGGCSGLAEHGDPGTRRWSRGIALRPLPKPEAKAQSIAVRPGLELSPDVLAPSSQGLTVEAPVFSKSWRSRVVMMRSQRTAVATRKESGGWPSRGRPSHCRASRTSAHTRASANVHSRAQPSSPRSTEWKRSARFGRCRPGSSCPIPFKISQTVTLARPTRRRGMVFRSLPSHRIGIPRSRAAHCRLPRGLVKHPRFLTEVPALAMATAE